MTKMISLPTAALREKTTDFFRSAVMRKWVLSSSVRLIYRGKFVSDGDIEPAEERYRVQLTEQTLYGCSLKLNIHFVSVSCNCTLPSVLHFLLQLKILALRK